VPFVRWFAASWWCLGLALCACDEGGPRRVSAGELASESLDAGGTTIVESNPAIEVGDEEDLMGTQCPGVRLYRAQRRWRTDAGGPSSTGPLSPRYFGRDDRGRTLSLSDVLLCELREMHWVTTPHGLGAAAVARALVVRG
jgi:hypothetical protein